MTIEPTQSSPSSEPDVHSGEDFVHIDDPRPTGDISLSDSIVNVDKDELLDEAAEEEFRGSDSVFSGGDGGGADDDGGECSSETIKVELPEDLAKSVVILTCESTADGGSCDVYLVGTAHVSKVVLVRFRLFLNLQRSCLGIKVGLVMVTSERFRES